MAPIPKDNQEKPPPKDESDFNSLSNPNFGITTVDSGSSDENDDNYPDTAGYVLLPQEPDEDYNETYLHDDEYADSNEDSTATPDGQLDSAITNNHERGDTCVIPDHLPDEVIQSEVGASAPTVAVSSTASLHPEFLAKFPDGKVPAYMQVPDVPTSTKDVLWNKKRADKSMSSLDSAQESKIITAMSGFSLPSENVPEWAKNMSDDQWNQHIVLQIKPTPGKSNKVQTETNMDASCEQKTNSQQDWVAEFPDS